MKLLNNLGTPGRILESTLLCKNNLLSLLIGREISIVCLILIFFSYLRVMSHAPPPPPTTPPAPEQSGWRKRKGQDYWERALNSFHSLLQPPVLSTTPPPTSLTPQPAPQLIRNINNNNTVCPDMDTSTNVKLSTAYYQTRNTKQAHNTSTVHNIDTPRRQL